MSLGRGATDGVRDHATLLAEALERENVACSTHWLARTEGSMLASTAQIRAWTRALVDELGESRPRVILLHYSVFAYAHRGLPLFVHPTVSAVRRLKIPVLTMLHEFVYPWTHGGWQGKVWALSQRAQLVEVMQASAAAIVTTEDRARWLASRRWLPRRRVEFAPVFSNLPPPAARPPAAPDGQLLGLFGYSYQGAALSLVLDALSRLAKRGLQVRLRLLGSPGPDSSVGRAWLEAARACEVEHLLSFSGRLPAQALADALGECEVLLFADRPGPTSRKGTLAGSLASGRPVVAIDGPNSWPKLTSAGAVALVAPSAGALADALGSLLADEGARERLGQRGRAFAEQELGVGLSAKVVIELLGEVRRGEL